MSLVDTVFYWLFRGYILLLRALPEKARVHLASSLIRTILIFLPRSVSVAERNLEVVFPDMVPIEKTRIYHESIDTLAWNLSGFAVTPTYTKEMALSNSNVEEFVEALNSLREKFPKKGIIIAGLHFGEFERGMQYHALCDRPVSVLARGFGLRKLDAWVNNHRGAYGVKVFERSGAFNKMVDYLGQGRDVSLLCDQNVKRNHAVFIDLFGVPAATTKSIGLAVLRTGSPVMFAVAVRENSGNLKFIFKPIEIPDSSLSREQFIAQLMTSLHREMEMVIRQYPEHWFWIHRRFKTRPAGEAETFYALKGSHADPAFCSSPH
jgi:KDO2-lipid IV(A) lauroyltransferase